MFRRQSQLRKVFDSVLPFVVLLAKGYVIFR